MTVRDDRLPTRQEMRKRSEMRSDAQKPHTFELLTWNHIFKDVHFLYGGEEKVPLSSVVSTSLRADAGCVERVLVAGAAKLVTLFRMHDENGA